MGNTYLQKTCTLRVLGEMPGKAF